MSDSYSSEYLQKTKKKKSRCITFRLEASIVEELTKESEQKEISLNVLVNQILRRYSEWDRYENKIRIIPVPKAMMTALIEKSLQIGREAGIKDLDVHRNRLIKEAASVAFESLRESVLFMKNQFNLFSVLSVLEEYMKVCGINSDHKFDAGRRHIFTMQHDMGENWSLFSKLLLEKIFFELAEAKVEITYTNSTVVAEVLL